MKLNCYKYEIVGGQILSRVIADQLKGDEIKVHNQKTIVAKSIGCGRIIDSDIILNDYKTELDEKRLTKEGDVVIKLTPPYYLTLIDKEHENILVSSFCSIIRNMDDLNKRFLVAYLNSDCGQKSLTSQVFFSPKLSTLSNKTISEIDIPDIEDNDKKMIIEEFEKMIYRKQLIDQIINLENKKINLMIFESENKKNGRD